MAKLDFHERWIGWIMMCVESVAYTMQLIKTMWVLFSPLEACDKVTPFTLSLYFMCRGFVSSYS